MNTRRNAGGVIGGATTRLNQVLPQGLAAVVEMHVNPTGLENREVRTSLVQMAQAITLKAQAMTAQADQQGIPKENPPASTMANRLRDFMRMNPPIYTGSRIVEDLEEEFRETMMHDSMDLSILMVHVQQVEKK
ncbi:hypothetical protein EJD97_002896 [Solanum chilense]|uniref:Uncharacterized protein n=1 Tax=Solanum chilense TaxID=4083 RepID=A0A6N2BZ47_SOLCI|nr:hypothetical protein EJD97_002896 [Solanum chilense]